MFTGKSHTRFFSNVLICFTSLLAVIVALPGALFFNDVMNLDYLLFRLIFQFPLNHLL